MLKKWGFYLLMIAVFLAGQMLSGRRLVSGPPPAIEKTTLGGAVAPPLLGKGPALIYFWAEWCGICRAIQGNVDAVIQDYPAVTIALTSGDDQTLRRYLGDQQLAWPTINDNDGIISQRYGVRAVPALLFTDQSGKIVFSSVGYTSEWGIRLRLWLAGLID